MKYPKQNPYLKITYNKNTGEYIIHNYLEDEGIKTYSKSFVDVLTMLDGKTDPYTLHDKDLIKEYLKLYLENGLLAKKTNPFLILKTLYKPKRITTTIEIISRYLNSIILILWAPLLILGLYVYFNNSFNYDIDITLIDSIMSMVISILIHEIAHSVAGVSYKASFYELGIGLLFFIIPFGYAVIDDSMIDKWKRTQILLSGIESNFILFGLAILLFSIIRLNIFAVLALHNITLAVLNLCIIKGSDGYKALLTLLAIDIDNENKAKKNKSLAYKIISNISYIGGCCLVIANVLGVLIWFFY